MRLESASVGLADAIEDDGEAMKERIGFQLGFCGLAGDVDEQYREDVLEQDVPQTSRNRLGDDEEGTNFGVCPLN